MSESYLMKLRPTEPYFFGNEKIFSFDPKKSEDNPYFIKSERFPLQTTILGALRFLLMPIKNPDYRYTQAQQQQNQKIIGADSFQMGCQTQNFGVIGKISPVFLINGQDKYVRTPFNHLAHIIDRYTPMTNHREITTDLGVRWYFPEFVAKNGISDSYMHTTSGSLVPADQIFSSTMQVGITKGSQEKSFYKKQRIRMESGWSFASYVELDTQRIAENSAAQAAFDALKTGTVVFLGQNKSAFTVSIQPEENTLAQDISVLLPPGVVYCLGDTLVTGDLYSNCLFAATQLRDYRAYRTVFQEDRHSNYIGTVSKESCLYKLICAGSVLIPDPKKEIASCIQNKNGRQIGFNTTIPNMED